MKILMCNRPKGTWVGGDMVQLESTMEALEERGHKCRFDDGSDLKAFHWADVVHLWNFSMKWTWGQFATAEMLDKPVVCSTIYHDTDTSLPFRIQQKMANGIDAFIFLCDKEAQRMKGRLIIDDSKAHIVPNGIEDYFFEKAPQNEDYVLTVGRLEEFKGQRHVAKACKELGLRYVCIGEGFDEKTLKELGAEVHPAMAREELVKWYAGCSAFILASKNEVFPMTVMEAGAQNKKIILTEDSCWFPEGAISCKYGDVGSIKEALICTNNGRIDVTGMRWGSVAEKIERVYECVLR